MLPRLFAYLNIGLRREVSESPAEMMERLDACLSPEKAAFVRKCTVSGFGELALSEYLAKLARNRSSLVNLNKLDMTYVQMSEDILVHLCNGTGSSASLIHLNLRMCTIPRSMSDITPLHATHVLWSTGFRQSFGSIHRALRFLVHPQTTRTLTIILDSFISPVFPQISSGTEVLSNELECLPINGDRGVVENPLAHILARFPGLRTLQIACNTGPDESYPDTYSDQRLHLQPPLSTECCPNLESARMPLYTLHDILPGRRITCLEITPVVADCVIRPDCIDDFKRAFADVSIAADLGRIQALKYVTSDVTKSIAVIIPLFPRLKALSITLARHFNGHMEYFECARHIVHATEHLPAALQFLRVFVFDQSGDDLGPSINMLAQHFRHFASLRRVCLSFYTRRNGLEFDPRDPTGDRQPLDPSAEPFAAWVERKEIIPQV